MKKRIRLSVLLRTLSLIFVVLSACGNKDAIHNKNDVLGGALILVTTSSDQIEPYMHLESSTESTKKGMLNADFESFFYILPNVAADLPKLIYAEDIDVLCSGSLSFIGVSVYNEAYERINFNETWDVISGLQKGTYYVGVRVRQEGEYVKKWNANESRTFECGFKLIK